MRLAPIGDTCHNLKEGLYVLLSKGHLVLFD